MKAALLAISLTTVAAVAPMGAAHAHGGVAIRVDTPAFGIRIGAPVPIVAPLPAYVAPHYVPAPVYAPPVPVVPVPLMRVHAPIVHAVVGPYGHRPFRHWHHGYKHPHRGIVAGGHPYGRY